jgi:DNA-binding transcriptional LysR family regulator
MDLRQLRYFAVLAEEKHFGRAAHRLSMSQPPLSQAIRRLEQELDARLFDRSSRHVALTPAGLVLQREAQALLRRAEETRVLVKETAQGRRGRLRVGFAGSMLYRGLPQILDDFRDRAPDIEVVLHELNSGEQADALGRDEIDLGFVHGRAIPQGLTGVLFHAEPFVACVQQSHTAATARTLRLERLKDEPFVLFSRAVSPDYYESIIATCLASGFLPRVRHEVRYWLTVVSLVAQGRGVALVPRSLAKSAIGGAAFVPIRGAEPVSKTWCVWTAAGEDGGSPALTTLIDLVRSYPGRGGFG